MYFACFRIIINMKISFYKIVFLLGLGIYDNSSDSLTLNGSPPVIYTAPVSGISGTLEYWRAVIDGKEIKPVDQMKDSVEIGYVMVQRQP